MSIYSIEVTTITGQRETLEKYKGDVLLIVNTATGCGFAPQLRGLEELYKEYKDKGFRVLGFPCSQFANQELASNDKIAEVCELNFGVTFPMHAKIDVKGDNSHPLFQKLTDDARGVLGSKNIKWNFTKFLVDRNGNVVKRFGSTTEPIRLKQAIEKLLQA